MQKLLFSLILAFWIGALHAQPAVYSAANAHSHNDYEQKEPFHQAYKAGFGSIEADIFLKEGKLYVAHDPEDIQPGRTLGALYILPVAKVFRRNKGKAFPDPERSFQLLIDLKTGADNTLPELVRQLEQYPELFDTDKNPHAVKVIISGNRPAPGKWTDFPSFIYFDGRPAAEYTAKTLEKTGLISDNFRNYSDWKGEGTPAETDREQLEKVVRKAHEQGKPFRFWAVPDTPAAWELMTELGVDYINTDKIEELATWLEKH